MTLASTIVSVANTVTLVAGILICWYLFGQRVRLQWPMRRALLYGVGTIAIGALVAGALHQFGTVSTIQAVAVNDSVTAVGMVLLGALLYLGRSGEDLS